MSSALRNSIASQLYRSWVMRVCSRYGWGHDQVQSCHRQRHLQRWCLHNLLWVDCKSCQSSACAASTDIHLLLTVNAGWHNQYSAGAVTTPGAAQGHSETEAKVSFADHQVLLPVMQQRRHY